MQFSEKELKLFSQIGYKNECKFTANSIKDTLKNSKRLKNQFEFQIYLQGSYKNQTNTYSSDIDIIVQLRKLLNRDISTNIDNERINTWKFFKQEIKEELNSKYGENNVSIGNKSIKLSTPYLYSEVDVVPCLEGYKYNYSHDKVYEAVNFWTNEETRLITSFPKLHYRNGLIKNRNTNKLYKPTVRMFKTLRVYLIENNIIKKEDISSYFIECILFNVPDSLYFKKYSKRILYIIYFLKSTNLKHFMHQHMNSKLLGNTPEQLSFLKAKKFIQKLDNFIN